MRHEDAASSLAAYALNALEADERRQVEEHLRGCAACRRELAAHEAAAAALAAGVEPVDPPAELRERILDAAAGSRPSERAARRWRPLALAAASLGAVSTAAAIGLAVWAVDLRGDVEAAREAAEVLADPAARSIPVEGATGRLVVGDRGEAALVVSGLPAAPDGRTYELWVIAGGEPRPAGLFQAAGERTVVRLSEPVPPGATVAVTVEPAGGVAAPTGDRVLRAEVPA